MKNGKLILTSLLVLLAVALSFQAVMAGDIDNLVFPKLNKIDIPKVEKKTLDNGIRLYLIEDKSLPTFEVQVRVNCGDYLEPADKVGLAAICGNVMRTGGTKKWSGDDLDELLEGIGGSVESSVDRISGSAYVGVLSDYTDLGIEVLAQVLRYPVFDEDKIELAKVQERTEISRRNDDPWPIVIREYRKVIYGADSPYGRHTEYSTINSITRDDLVSFHDKYYHPENIQMAIWGDFKKKDVIKKIEKYFGDWQKGNIEVPMPPKVNYEFISKVYYIEKKDSPQANILMGHIGGLEMDDDYPARIVMNSILGGNFGSRLVDNVRSKEGLAYSTGGNYSANIQFPGIFYAYAFTKHQSVVQAASEMIKQIKSMQTDPPTELEMRKGVDGYLNSFVFNFDSKAEVVGRIMTYDFYGLPEDLLFKRKEAVENVTAEQIMTAAKENLRPDYLQIVILGDKDQFDLPLDSLGLGPVTQLDITIPSGEVKADIEVTPEKLQKGKEILMAAVAAHGGIKNHKKITALSRKGTMTVSTPQGEFPLQITSISQFPDKNKSVVNMFGREMVNIRNGNEGWQSDQTGGIAPKTPEDIAEDELSTLRDETYIFINADSPDYKVVYEGADKLDGKDVECLVLLDNAGEKLCQLGFYKDTNMLAFKSYWGATPLGEGNIKETYENYSDISGVKIPMISIVYMDGQQVTKVDLSECVINPEIPAGTFAKP